MGIDIKLGRRGFSGILAGLAAASVLRAPAAMAAAPDGAGAVQGGALTTSFQSGAIDLGTGPFLLGSNPSPKGNPQNAADSLVEHFRMADTARTATRARGSHARFSPQLNHPSHDQ